MILNKTSSDSIHNAVSRYYDEAISAFGPSAKGVDWKDDESHRLRHRQFLRLVADHPQASLLDLGCGYGDFLTVLREAGHKGRYTGCDVSMKMIDAALALHGEGPDRDWIVSAEPAGLYDFAIASGIMNVRRGANPEQWAGYVEDTIGRLAASSRLGFGFNMLTLNSDPERRRADLHYADPVEMLATCIKRFGRSVALLQDYGLWEFTVLVRHSSQTASPTPAAP